MRNLNKADIVPKDLLNSVILSKRGSNKTRMEAMRNDLEERYDEYYMMSIVTKLITILSIYYPKNGIMTRMR